MRKPYGTAEQYRNCPIAVARMDARMTREQVISVIADQRQIHDRLERARFLNTNMQYLAKIEKGTMRCPQAKFLLFGGVLEGDAAQLWRQYLLWCESHDVPAIRTAGRPASNRPRLANRPSGRRPRPRLET